MRKFLSLCLVALLLSASTPRLQAQAQQDVRLTTGSSYVAIRGVSWANFNINYVLVPNDPAIGVCFYIVNNNPTNSHTFSVAVKQTADGGALDYQNNTSRYQTVQIASLTSPVTLNPLTTVSGYSGTTAAAQIAFIFTGASTQAGSPDTADLFFVQTRSSGCGAAPSNAQVQGAVNAGVTAVGTNPVDIGGPDGTDNKSRFFTALQNTNATTANSTQWGIAIGQGGLNPLSGWSTGDLPNAGSPLLVALTAQNGQNATGNLTTLNAQGTGGVPGNTTAGAAGQSLPALLVADNGYTQVVAATPITGSGTAQVGITPFALGSFDACLFSVEVTAVSGTAPTLDVYVQSSINGLNYFDRVHFAQITTTGNFVAGITAHSTAGLVPQAMTQNALAVGTVLNGPIGGWLRFSYVVTGTTPSFTTRVSVNCH